MLTDWLHILERFAADPDALSCAAMPTPCELRGWTLAKVSSLLDHRQNETSLLINGMPATAYLAALPADAPVSTLDKLVELEAGHPGGLSLTLRLPLADAVDFLLTQSFSELRRLRFQRLRVANVRLRAEQDSSRALTGSSDSPEPTLPAR